MAAPSPDTLEHLTHLSQKPSVIATLILLRSTGSIVRSSGFPEPQTLDDTSSARDVDDDEISKTRRSPNKGELKTARMVAAAVYRFFQAAEGLQGDMCVSGGEDTDGVREGSSAKGSAEDEVKLLRMRMKRMEVVIVPGES